MNERLAAIRASVTHLRRLVDGLSADQLDAHAYPSGWTIAQVLSHIGSGAMILGRRLDDSLAGLESPADFAPSVWDA